jgi:hypothetical protein
MATTADVRAFVRNMERMPSPLALESPSDDGGEPMATVTTPMSARSDNGKTKRDKRDKKDKRDKRDKKDKRGSKARDRSKNMSPDCDSSYGSGGDSDDEDRPLRAPVQQQCNCSSELKPAISAMVDAIAALTAKVDAIAEAQREQAQAQAPPMRRGRGRDRGRDRNRHQSPRSASRSRSRSELSSQSRSRSRSRSSRSSRSRPNAGMALAMGRFDKVDVELRDQRNLIREVWAAVRRLDPDAPYHSGSANASPAPLPPPPSLSSAPRARSLSPSRDQRQRSGDVPWYLREWGRGRDRTDPRSERRGSDDRVRPRPRYPGSSSGGVGSSSAAGRDRFGSPARGPIFSPPSDPPGLVPLDRPVDDDGPLGGHSRMSDLDGEPSEDFGRLGDLGGPHSSRAMPQSPLERLASEPFSVLDETPLSPGVARREFWRP